MQLSFWQSLIHLTCHLSPWMFLHPCKAHTLQCLLSTPDTTAKQQLHQLQQFLLVGDALIKNTCKLIAMFEPQKQHFFFPNNSMYLTSNSIYLISQSNMCISTPEMSWISSFQLFLSFFVYFPHLITFKKALSMFSLSHTWNIWLNSDPVK